MSSPTDVLDMMLGAGSLAGVYARQAMDHKPPPPPQMPRDDREADRETLLSLPSTECGCETCRNACQRRPGWFLPSQIDPLLEHFGKPLSELIGDKLCWDWWGGGPDGTIHVLAPQIVGEDGDYMISWPTGFDQCVFYQDDRCSIHEVKPYECSIDIHGLNHNRVHEAVAMEWNDDGRWKP